MLYSLTISTGHGGNYAPGSLLIHTPSVLTFLLLPESLEKRKKEKDPKSHMAFSVVSELSNVRISVQDIDVCLLCLIQKYYTSTILLYVMALVVDICSCVI